MLSPITTAGICNFDADDNDDAADQVHRKGSIIISQIRLGNRDAVQLAALNAAVLCRSSAIHLVDLRESLGARAKLCPSSWQKAQKLHRWLLEVLKYATILSVVLADLVWIFAQRTLSLTPKAQSSFRVRPSATCCDTLESQGRTALMKIIDVHS